MTNTQQSLIQIVRAYLNNKSVQIDSATNHILSLAQKHEIAHLIKCDATKKLCDKQIAKHLVQNYAADELVAECERACITILPLKGICTQKRYIAPEIRSMGDLDFLYKVEDGKAIKELLISLEYEWLGENQKHDHYIRKPFVDVEMHRELVAADSDFSWYYKDIWERCNTREGYSYIYEMSVEDEFVFNIVHMTEHFKESGIGIRPVMDVFVYNHLQMNFDYVNAELSKLHLFDFYKNISFLSEKWFGKIDDNEKIPKIIERLEEFILEGGVYGSSENASSLAVSNGRLASMIHMCFPSFGRMKSAYTWLVKFPYLLPVAWLLRGIRVFFGRKKELKKQITIWTSGDRNKGLELKNFIKECGL